MVIYVDVVHAPIQASATRSSAAQSSLWAALVDRRATAAMCGPAQPARRHSTADKWLRLPPTAEPDAVYPANRPATATELIGRHWQRR